MRSNADQGVGPRVFELSLRGLYFSLTYLMSALSVLWPNLMFSEEVQLHCFIHSP